MSELVVLEGVGDLDDDRGHSEGLRLSAPPTLKKQRARFTSWMAANKELFTLIGRQNRTFSRQANL